MEPQDNQLIQRINEGDYTCFATLVDRYSTPIYNLMYRYSGCPDDAADLTQDIFCKAFEKIGTYREKQRFFSWLYTLALNHVKDWSRKNTNNRKKLLRFAWEADKEKNQRNVCLVESSQQVGELQKALALLPDENREMVLLKYQQDLSIQELSEIFQLSESAVKMRLHRSLGEIRKILTGAENEL